MLGVQYNIRQPARGVLIKGVRACLGSDAQMARAKAWPGTGMWQQMPTALQKDMYIVQTVQWGEMVIIEQRALREPAGEVANQENYCSKRLPGKKICQRTHRLGERMQSK